MSTLAWIIFLILILPAIGLLIWIILAASFVRVPSGSLGLVMARGKATDRSLPPGGHFVFALRRVIIEEYPSVELAYRADGLGDTEQVGFKRSLGDRRVNRGSFDRLEVSGPTLQVTLGDRTEATVVVTVRFQLLPENLKQVHERYGPNGVFGVVRDVSTRAVLSTLAWIIFLILILPAIGLLVWIILAASFVRVPSGSLGLVMARGKATDRSLPPGGHFVFALRRVIIEEYPSVELAYRADGLGDTEQVGFKRSLGDRRVNRGSFDRLEVSGPTLQVTLGDRTEATVVVTVRFQLLPEYL
jgi:hypothetical protein